MGTNKTKTRPDKKTCPKCQTEKPAEAFRKDSNRYDLLDSFCKKCRALDAKAKRPRENARWKRRRLALAAEGKEPSVKPKEKVNARRTAQRAFPKKQSCTIKGCANRGHLHHWAGYDRDNWKNVIPLCPQHHAQQHVLERARKRLAPTYL